MIQVTDHGAWWCRMSGSRNLISYFQAALVEGDIYPDTSQLMLGHSFFKSLTYLQNGASVY